MPAVRDRALGGLRWKIDLTDSMLALLMEQRLSLSLETQAFKAEEGMPAYDQEREERIRLRLISEGRPPEVVRAMMRLVQECREAWANRVSATFRPAAAGSST
jgi:chorismate mutase